MARPPRPAGGGAFRLGAGFWGIARLAGAPTATSTVAPTAGSPAATDTPTLPPAATAAGTATAARSPPARAGDCDADGTVSIDELVRGVNIALGAAPLERCPPFDTDGDARVTVDELVRAVNAALGGCHDE